MINVRIASFTDTGWTCHCSRTPGVMDASWVWYSLKKVVLWIQVMLIIISEQLVLWIQVRLFSVNKTTSGIVWTQSSLVYFLVWLVF